MMKKDTKSKKVLNVPHLRFKEFSGEWEEYTLNELCLLITKQTGFDYSSTIKPALTNLPTKNTYPFLQNKDFNEFNINLETDFYIPDYIAKSFPKILLDSPSILISISGKIGNVGFYDLNTVSFIGGAICICKINNKETGKFILYELLSSKKQRHFKELVKASSHFNITVEDIREITIYLPQNNLEKIKILKLLTLIDKRIETQMKIIEEYKSLIKGIREEILFKNNLFEEITIKKAMNKKLIRVIKPNELSYFEGQKKYLSTSSINENGIEKIECYITYNNRPSRASMKPIKNSVWFAKMKNSIKVFHSIGNDENEYILSTGFYGILSLSNLISPFWLEQIFKSDYFNNQKDKFSEGSSMSGVKDNQFSDLKIKIFKNMNIEQKYIYMLKLLENYLKNNLQIIKLLYDEKRYLLSNLFI